MFEIQEVWDIRIVLDLFFGGMGAGAFLMGYYLYLKGKKDFGLKVTLSGVISLIIGLGILVTHLGKPEAAIWAMLTPQLGSVMTWGIFFNVFFMIFGLAFSGTLILPMLPWSKREKDMKTLGGLGALFAFLVMSYTGALLASTSIPIWRNPATPLLFILVSISSGIGLYMLMAHLFKHEIEHIAIIASLATTIGVLVIIVSMIVIAPVSHVAFKESVCMLLGEMATVFYAVPQRAVRESACIFIGQLAPIFYLLLFAGILAPLLTLVTMLRGNMEKRWIIITGLLLILQSFLVRYLIVSSGIIYLPW